jgi:hypothetical protein
MEFVLAKEDKHFMQLHGQTTGNEVVVPKTQILSVTTRAISTIVYLWNFAMSVATE